MLEPEDQAQMELGAKSRDPGLDRDVAETSSRFHCVRIPRRRGRCVTPAKHGGGTVHVETSACLHSFLGVEDRF